MRDGLAELIENKTKGIEDAVTSRESKADRLIFQFLVRQRDQRPTRANKAKVEEAQQKMNSSQQSFSP